MRKYNHTLQYVLALDAVHSPPESVSFFPEQLKKAELIIDKQHNINEVRFMTVPDERGICDVSQTLIRCEN